MSKHLQKCALVKDHGQNCAAIKLTEATYALRINCTHPRNTAQLLLQHITTSEIQTNRR